MEYASAIPTESQTRIERLEKVRNEAMRIILIFTINTPSVAMRFLLDFHYKYPMCSYEILTWFSNHGEQD